jgi:hypothetical protein
VLGAEGAWFTHDCSTQQVDFGSAIVGIETALLAGSHLESGLTESFAVTAEVVGKRRERLP